VKPKKKPVKKKPVKKKPVKKKPVIVPPMPPVRTEWLYVGHVISRSDDKESGCTYLRFARSREEALGRMISSASEDRPDEAIVSSAADLCPDHLIRRAAEAMGMK
jgi:hypothetical protein